jgi:hypothetical protein
MAYRVMNRLLPKRTPRRVVERRMKTRAISELRTMRTSIAPTAKGKR